MGIYQAGGSVYEDYNLLAGNPMPISGTIAGGTHNASGDLRAANPAADDYHLRIGSAAIDAGIDVGVTTDIDGDSRPIGPCVDIGYDEFATVVRRLYLPAILR